MIEKIIEMNPLIPQLVILNSLKYAKQLKTKLEYSHNTTNIHSMTLWILTKE